MMVWRWTAIAVIGGSVLVGAAFSPLHGYRDAVYSAASFAGILGMIFLLVQPLLASGYLSGPAQMQARRVHRVIGYILVAAVVAHVAGLWLTSPPDVIDALIFASPTPFSVWGVIAMWAIFATALWAGLRKRFRTQLRIWRLGHAGLAVVIVFGTALHAILIDGVMNPILKIALAVLVIAATCQTIIKLKIFKKRSVP